MIGLFQGDALTSNHRQSDAEPMVAELLANAIALHQAGQIADAIKLYQEVMRRDSLNFDAIYLQGMAAQQIGQSLLAEKLMRLAVSIRPDSAQALNELGHILKGKGELAQALDCYVAVLRLRPDSVATQVNIAMVLSDMGHMHEAMQYCQVALSLNPDFVPALVLLGRMHHQRMICQRSWPEPMI
jgi:tetratricopeptide (TPR) repeat protein